MDSTQFHAFFLKILMGTKGIKIKSMRFIITVYLLTLALYAIAQKSDLQKENIKGKVISVTETEYNFESKFGENIKLDSNKSTQTFYDEYGNIFKIITNEGDIIHYKYDSNRKIIANITLRDKPIKDIETKAQGMTRDTIQVTKFLYAKNGKLVEENNYKYEYNNLRSKKIVLSSKVKHFYSSNEEIIDTYNEHGELSAKTIIARKGNKIGEKTGGFYTVKEYNLKNQLINEMFYIGANNGSAASKSDYYYNSYGDIHKIENKVEVFNENHTTMDIYKYNYDSQQNWNCRKIFKNEKMTKWTERIYMYANTASELAITHQTNLQKEQMEVEQMQQLFSQKIDSIKQKLHKEKEKKIKAQIIQDSIIKENHKFNDLIQTVFETHVIRQYSLGSNRYKIINYTETIKKAFIKDHAVIFILKDNTELPALTFNAKSEISPSKELGKCTLSYTKDKKYILMLFHGYEFTNEAGILIRCLPNDKYHIYNLNNKTISIIKNEKSIDRLDRNANKVLKILNSL